MVDYGFGPYEEGMSDYVFVVPGICVTFFAVFFTYKLVSSLRQKERAKEEKKKMKQQRKEKEMSKKQKKK